MQAFMDIFYILDLSNQHYKRFTLVYYTKSFIKNRDIDRFYLNKKLIQLIVFYMNPYSQN